MAETKDALASGPAPAPVAAAGAPATAEPLAESFLKEKELNKKRKELVTSEVGIGSTAIAYTTRMHRAVSSSVSRNEAGAREVGADQASIVEN
jgi:hypothetical protein